MFSNASVCIRTPTITHAHILRCLSVGSTSMHHDHSARRESLNTDGVNSAERNTILQIVKLKEHVKVGYYLYLIHVYSCMHTHTHIYMHTSHATSPLPT